MTDNNTMSTEELAALCDTAVAEMIAEHHDGWPNTVTWAATRLRELREENGRMKGRIAELERETAYMGLLTDRMIEAEQERDALRAEVERLREDRPRLPDGLRERLRAQLAEIEPLNEHKTHWEGCEASHELCRRAALFRDLLAWSEGEG